MQKPPLAQTHPARQRLTPHLVLALNHMVALGPRRRHVTALQLAGVVLKVRARLDGLLTRHDSGQVLVRHRHRLGARARRRLAARDYDADHLAHTRDQPVGEDVLVQRHGADLVGSRDVTGVVVAHHAGQRQGLGARQAEGGDRASKAKQ